ncbi:MAG TPA: MerR family transcriptional regulator [Terriglobales bacterium]|nr:MerR family transcriptional regulator [Terriglobales bacterium]
MPLLTISEVASQIGLRPSAIRYYEQIGILPPAQRINRQRRYDMTALYRLIVIQKARRTGFSLPEIKQLFYGFRAGTPPSARWQKLKRQKIVELDAMLEHIRTMRSLVQQHGNCGCRALEECGRKLFERQCAKASRSLARRTTTVRDIGLLVRSNDGDRKVWKT